MRKKIKKWIRGENWWRYERKSDEDKFESLNVGSKPYFQVK